MQHLESKPSPQASRRSNGGCSSPRYPNVRVRLASHHPLAAISAIRHALRRAGVPACEVRRFTEEAIAASATRRAARDVLRDWAVIDFVEAS